MSRFNSASSAKHIEWDLHSQPNCSNKSIWRSGTDTDVSACKWSAEKTSQWKEEMHKPSRFETLRARPSAREFRSRVDQYSKSVRRAQTARSGHVSYKQEVASSPVKSSARMPGGAIKVFNRQMKLPSSRSSRPAYNSVTAQRPQGDGCFGAPPVSNTTPSFQKQLRRHLGDQASTLATEYAVTPDYTFLENESRGALGQDFRYYAEASGVRNAEQIVSPKDRLNRSKHYGMGVQQLNKQVQRQRLRRVATAPNSARASNAGGDIGMDTRPFFNEHTRGTGGLFGYQQKYL